MVTDFQLLVNSTCEYGGKDVLTHYIGFLDTDSHPKLPTGVGKLVDQLFKAVLSVLAQNRFVSKHFSQEYCVNICLGPKFGHTCTDEIAGPSFWPQRQNLSGTSLKKPLTPIAQVLAFKCGGTVP